MSKFADFLTSSFSCYGSGAFVLCLLSLVTLEVVARTVFNSPLIFTEEYSTYFMAATSVLGMSYTLKKGGHVKIDFLLNLLGGRVRGITELVHKVLGVVCTIALTYVVFMMLITYYRQGTTSFSLLRTPLYPVIVPLALGMVLFTLAAVLELVSQVRRHS